MRFPHDVRGWLSREEGKKLAELAAGRLVLEIGSYEGRSTICLAQTARLVHAVDWHKGDSGAGFGWTLPKLLENLRLYGLEDKVIVHSGPAVEVGRVLCSRYFDLAFIDGAHDEASVTSDLEIAKRCVVSDGVIAMHDWGVASVERAAEKVLGWKSGSLVGSLLYRRLDERG